jgi:hypothetical protein
VVSFLSKLGSWLLQKLAIGVLIVVLGLAAYGLWLFVNDQLHYDERKSVQLQELVAERDRLGAARAEIEKRFAAFQADLKLQQDRAHRAEKIIETLRSLESWWERWFGNREQQEINARNLAQTERMRSETARKIQELQQELTRISWDRDGAELALGRVEREIRLTEARRSPFTFYLQRAWDASKWYVVTALLLYFFGPTVGKVFLYYGFAPLISRGKPIRLADSLDAFPLVGASGVSVEAGLWPGEILRVKEKFLQASDEGVRKQTRFVLDWRIPFTSVACGLIELVELRHGHAGGEHRVTLSNSDDPHIELAIIQVPEAASLVLRPSYLAGVIQNADQPLSIKRRWQIFRWQSWVTLQFRFFEFLGPCRLIVAGSRGVRAERLLERDGNLRPARRTNQDATIGFTPNLEYRPVRAETFWSYYRGMNPLFDDVFAGPGLFLVQETATPGAGGKPNRFWSTLWNGVLKVFGL